MKRWKHTSQFYVGHGPQRTERWDHVSADGTRFLSEGRVCPLRPWLEENLHFTATVTYGKRLDFIWSVHLEVVGDPPARIKAHVALAFPVSTSAKSTALHVVSPVRGREHALPHSGGLASKCPCPDSEFPSLNTPLSLCSLLPGRMGGAGLCLPHTPWLTSSLSSW